MASIFPADEQLVERVRRGDERAFELLVRRYRPQLLAFCRHMLCSREDAEDALQEILASAHRAMVGDDRPLVVRPWLYRIARNRCLNQLRRSRPVGLDCMDVFVGMADTGEAAERREDLRELVADLRALPERQRAAILMREVGGLGWAEIGQALDATIPSVKSLLVRARVNLAEARMARRAAPDPDAPPRRAAARKAAAAAAA